MLGGYVVLNVVQSDLVCPNSD